MLSVTCKPCTLSVVMIIVAMLSFVMLSVVKLRVTCKPYMGIVIMLNAVKLNVAMLSVYAECFM